MQDFIQALAGAQSQPNPAVARLIIGTGEDQIAHPGQSHKGIGFTTECNAKTHEFSQTTRNQCSARVGAETQTIADTCGQCHDIFDCTTQLHAGEIIAGIRPHPLVAQPPRDMCRCRWSVGGDRQGGGQTTRHFTGKTRAGYNPPLDLRPQNFVYDIAQQLTTATVKAFAAPGKQYTFMQI